MIIEGSKKMWALRDVAICEIWQLEYFLLK
jgi:hypothetical protein